MEQHRFGPVLPPYLQVSREDRVHHLTERHSGARHGAVLRIAYNGIDDCHAALAARQCDRACLAIAVTFANAVGT